MPGWSLRSWMPLLILGPVLVVACAEEAPRRKPQPLAPGGAGGSEPTQVPPPIVHAPAEPIDVEILGPQVGAPSDVWDVGVDAGGGVWIAATDGLFVRRPGGHFFDPVEGLPDARVDAVGGLASGVAAVSFHGAPPRIVRVAEDGTTSVEPLDVYPVVARFRTVDTASGRFAVLATGLGIAVIDGDGRVRGTRVLPPPAADLWDVALTAAGDVWAGDANRLLRLAGPVTQTLAGQVMATLDLIPDAADDVVAIEVCPDDSVRVSALGHGVFELGPTGRQRAHLIAAEVLPQDHVPSLACTPDGTVWFGTSWGGLARRDPDGSFHYHTAAAGLPGDSIRRLLVVEEPAGGWSLWIGTERGVAILRGG